MARLPDWMRMEPQMMAKKRPDGDGTPDKTEKNLDRVGWWVGPWSKDDRMMEWMTGWGYHGRWKF